MKLILYTRTYIETLDTKSRPAEHPFRPRLIRLIRLTRIVFPNFIKVELFQSCANSLTLEPSLP